MIPSPSNNSDQDGRQAAKSERKETPLPEQSQTETAANLHNETPYVVPQASNDDLPDELSADERDQAKAALAFLEEVRKEQLDSQTNSHLPAAIGRYSILRSLGRGGFAEVFLAEDEELDRRVALKVPLFNSAVHEAGSQRFEREARLAASLGHPQIVPVYEYGDLGPVRFIAFAWCDGPTLDQWVKDNGPVDFGTAAKIVEHLAQAVQHAHQRGIIHRDLKPGNVLVDSSEDSQSKPIWDRLRITDFGLARNFDNHDATLTQDGQMVGTPAYMAPEQAGSGTEVGPAADVWALGIMLFELLTGELPFRKPELLATIRSICDDPLPKAKRIRREIPRGLEAVAELSLRKDPAERYQSAHDLAEDLRHFVAGEPVKARPQSAISTLSLWARRNPAIATFGSLAFLFLVLGLAGTTWQYLRATDNLSLAQTSLEEEQKARSKAQRVAGMFAKTYRRAIPGSDGRILKVVDMLDLTANEIENEFADDQESRWELLYELARTYDGLGVYEPAVSLLQQIYDEQSDSEDAESERTLRTVIALQRSLHSMADFDRSSQRAAEAVELANKLDVDGELLAKVLEGMGLVLEHDGKHREALANFEQAIAACESDENCELSDTLTARTLMANSQRMLGQFEEAAEWLEIVVDRAARQYGNDQPEVITLMQEYASILMKLKRYEAAIEVFQQQLTISKEVMGPEHGRTLQIKSNLASTLTLVGRRAEAIEVYREVVATSEKSYGHDNPNTAIPRLLMGKQLLKTGQFAEAEPQLRKSYEVLFSTAGIDHPWTEKAHQALVWLWFRTNAWDRTIDHCLERATAYDDLSNDRAITRAALARIEAGQAMIRADKLDAGLDMIEKYLEVLRDGQHSVLITRYHSSILSALVFQSAFEEAIPYAKNYVAKTPQGYEQVVDFFSSRIQAAAIGLRTGNTNYVEHLTEIDVADAIKLNAEQWLLLSTSLEILENGIEKNDPTCVKHSELISSLRKMYEKAVNP